MEDAQGIDWQEATPIVCASCLGSNVIAIEYGYSNPERYDGISEYKCLDCDYRQGRWTGKQLKMGYIEPRFGRGGEPVPIPEE